MNEPQVVGMQPWLPWPFRLWRSWTEPAPAERLAALRIGLAMVLLVDVLTSYWPNLEFFFGPESLTRQPGLDPFAYYTSPPRWSWSLLRGLDQPNNFALILGLWGVVTVWALASSARPGMAAWAWTIATFLAVASFWTRLEGGDYPSDIAWQGGIGLGFVALAWCLAGFLCLWNGHRQHRRLSPAFLVPWIMTTLLLGLGIQRFVEEQETGALSWRLRMFFADWDQNLTVLRVAMLAWLTAIVGLLVGWRTRLMAVAVWVLANSFDNLNPFITYKGDVVRNILLFYLVISPCGAVWSVDRRLSRRPPGPTFIYPWVLRLIFLQMVFMYFFNGLYKLLGEHWRTGEALYFVLANPVRSRVSYAQFPVPFFVLQIFSTTVLVWELSFPLLVALRWTRIPALILGVLFHVGIGTSMELEFFSAYMLTMYLPLLPWEKLRRLDGAGGHSAFTKKENQIGEQLRL